MGIIVIVVDVGVEIRSFRPVIRWLVSCNRLAKEAYEDALDVCDAREPRVDRV